MWSGLRSPSRASHTSPTCSFLSVYASGFSAISPPTQVCRMGLRFFKPTKASLHETLSTRAAHDISVRGPVRRLLHACEQLRAASTSDGDELLLPYWLVAALALPLLGPNPDVPPEDWAIHLWEFFASPRSRHRYHRYRTGTTGWQRHRHGTCAAVLCACLVPPCTGTDGYVGYLVSSRGPLLFGSPRSSLVLPQSSMHGTEKLQSITE